jgi:RNA-directed DNA polymerase
MAFVGGTESELAERRAESPATEQWMEEVCERDNCKQALRRVKANKGSPGIDGMTVEQLPGHLKEHWPAIREQLLSGIYRPQPVKRVEIPKPDGGVRKLGIPSRRSCRFCNADGTRHSLNTATGFGRNARRIKR